MFDKLHQNQRNLAKSNMKAIYGEEDLEKSELIDSAADFLEKGKKANLGEVREWNGRKYQKTTQGWKPAGKATNSKENGGEKEKFEQPDKGLVIKKLQEKVDSMSSEEASSLLDKLNASKEKYGKLDKDSEQLKGMLEKKVGGGEKRLKDFQNKDDKARAAFSKEERVEIRKEYFKQVEAGKTKDTFEEYLDKESDKKLKSS